MPIRRNRLLEEWIRFKTMCIPGDAGVNQVEDMKKAFYAGARVLMDTIMHNLSSGKCSEKEDEKLLEDLELELRDFTAALLRRKQ